MRDRRVVRAVNKWRLAPLPLMYTALVCFALFDAQQGAVGLITAQQPLATALLAAFLLGLRYLPAVFHRPQLVDAFCEDLLCLTAHSVCLVVPDPTMRYACALHSTCHLLQTQFRPHTPSVLIHTVGAVWLLLAYAYGPRVSDLKPFLLAVSYPSVAGVLAKALTHTHRLAVLWLMTDV